MKIWHVPIEVVPNRYTADWIQQFEDAFKLAAKDPSYKKHNIEFETIGDRNPRPIQVGSVLDAYATSNYKLNQVRTLIDRIQTGQVQDGDVIFVADGWFPGLEALLYIRALTKKEFGIATVWHAGSYDPQDFVSRAGMRNWAQHQELAWLNGVDAVFVATQFHKDLMVMNSGEFDETKVIVTGIPFYAEKLRSTYLKETKQNIVVFPHRMDPEKHPEKFDKLATRIKKKFPGWAFVKTIDATKDASDEKKREEYFRILARAKVMVSYAEQETFGYSTVEAMALGCYPIVPNRLSYREIVPEEYRYMNDKSVDDMVIEFMQKEEPYMWPTLTDLDQAKYDRTLGHDLTFWASSADKIIKSMIVRLRDLARHRISDEATKYQEQIKKYHANMEKETRQYEEKVARAERGEAPVLSDSDKQSIREEGGN